jgi:hypothetical protein
MRSTIYLVRKKMESYRRRVTSFAWAKAVESYGARLVVAEPDIPLPCEKPGCELPFGHEGECITRRTGLLKGEVVK